jgi:hypothetical protein
MLDEACNLILGRVAKNLEGRAEVRRALTFLPRLALTLLGRCCRR